MCKDGASFDKGTPVERQRRKASDLRVLMIYDSGVTNTILHSVLSGAVAQFAQLVSLASFVAAGDADEITGFL